MFMDLQEALKDWRWLEVNILSTLDSFECSGQATDFVTVKIESVLTVTRGEGAGSGSSLAETLEDSESLPYKTASEKFHRLFNVGQDDKLVRPLPFSIPAAPQQKRCSVCLPGFRSATILVPTGRESSRPKVGCI